MASNEGRWEDARKYLERSIELDDGIYDAWRTLAEVYTQLGDHHALIELKKHYRARFGIDLR